MNRCSCCGHPICECIELEMHSLKVQGEDLAEQLNNAVAKGAEYAYGMLPDFDGPAPIAWTNLPPERRAELQEKWLAFVAAK